MPNYDYEFDYDANPGDYPSKAFNAKRAQFPMESYAQIFDRLGYIYQEDSRKYYNAELDTWGWMSEIWDTAAYFHSARKMQGYVGYKRVVRRD